MVKNAKLHLSPCQAAVGFAVLFLPRPLLLTLSKQLEQILFYWGFYQVQGISASSSAQAFSELVQCPKMAPSEGTQKKKRKGICTVCL